MDKIQSNVSYGSFAGPITYGNTASKPGPANEVNDILHDMYVEGELAAGYGGDIFSDMGDTTNGNNNSGDYGYSDQSGGDMWGNDDSGYGDIGL